MNISLDELEAPLAPETNTSVKGVILDIKGHVDE